MLEDRERLLGEIRSARSSRSATSCSFSPFVICSTEREPASCSTPSAILLLSSGVRRLAGFIRARAHRSPAGQQARPA